MKKTICTNCKHHIAMECENCENNHCEALKDCECQCWDYAVQIGEHKYEEVFAG